jgi:[ribosomal protein S5]-alanine N-acetyltransferase
MLQPSFETQRLFLRPVEAGDQQKVFEGFSHPVVTQYMEITYITFEAASEQMEWYRKNRETGSGYAWVVGDKSDPASFLGVLSIYHVNHKHRRCELGYWLFPEYWGKGYTAEGIAPILEFISGALNMHRIGAEVEPQNNGSIRVLEKLGFQKEAFLRDYEVNNGRYLNLEIWSRLFDN